MDHFYLLFMLYQNLQQDCDDTGGATGDCHQTCLVTALESLTWSILASKPQECACIPPVSSDLMTWTACIPLYPIDQLWEDHV